MSRETEAKGLRRIFCHNVCKAPEERASAHSGSAPESRALSTRL